MINVTTFSSLIGGFMDECFEVTWEVGKKVVLQVKTPVLLQGGLFTAFCDC